MENGFVLISRELLEHPIFASEKLLKIFIWCLCKANYKEKSVPLKTGKGQTIVNVKRGQFIFGRNKAEEELFIDGSTIYKSIKKLEELGSIFIKSNNKYSIITICNYDSYQDFKQYEVASKEQVSNNQGTTKEQQRNNQGTQLIQDKAKESKKKKDIEYPTLIETENYFFESGFSKEAANKFYNFYAAANWHDSKGKKVLSWKQKAQSVWFTDENKVKQPQKELKPWETPLRP